MLVSAAVKLGTHHHDISRRFSSAARTYDGISALQDRVARRLMDLVDGPFSPLSVLDAGCGTGRLILLARKRWPHARCTGVDIAPGMVQEAALRFSGDPLVSIVQGDIVDHAPASLYDLVLSSSSLHWLRPFPEGLARTARLCGPQGLMAAGIMLNGSLIELHEARLAAAPGKPAAGRLPDFGEFETAARSISGFRVRRIEQVTAEFDQPSAREVLRTVHEMGVTGGDVSRAHAPLTRGELARLADYYDRRFASPQGVRMTFNVGYLLLERTGS